MLIIAIDVTGITYAKGHIQTGDCIEADDLHSLGKSLPAILKNIDYFMDRDIHIVIKRLGINTTKPNGLIMLNVIREVAMYDRELRSKAIKKGMETGTVPRGREPIPEHVMTGVIANIERGIPVARACRDAGISRDSYYKRTNTKRKRI